MVVFAGRLRSAGCDVLHTGRAALGVADENVYDQAEQRRVVHQAEQRQIAQNVQR